MALKQGKYVLKNRFGQVVRTFSWQQPDMVLIYRHDNRRIEAVANTRDLSKREVAFDVLAEIKREQIRKQELAIGSVGTLRWVDDIEVVAPEVTLKEEDRSNYIAIFKWTVLTYVLFMGFILGLGYMLKPAPPTEQVVKIINTPESLAEMEKQAKNAPTVDASEKKLDRTQKIQDANVSQTSQKVKDARSQVTHSNVKSGNSKRHGGFVGPESGDPNNAGVLGVLGSQNRKGTGRGGFNPANAKSTGGFGTGKGGGGYGGHGAGGIPRAIFGQGMIAANPGSGSSAPGAGGYGRAGFGGGGRKGYGNLSMVGASKVYFSPVEEEAIVEGGLDREQIAEIIQRNMGQIVYCYEQGLQVKPNLAGRVAVKFVISNNGHVSSANVATSSLHDGRVEGCIVSKLRTWKFPTPQGGVNVRVTYPFVLKRVSSR